MTKRDPSLCSKSVLTAAVLFASLACPATAEDAGLHSAAAIVTGQGDENRQIGFRECLAEVLVKVSGDPAIPADSRFAALLPRAGVLVDSFRYRDLLEGVPIHDEQGTYDRPHELTCSYRPAVLDSVLASLGRKPWTAGRPKLAMFLSVRQGARSYRLSRDGDENPAMEESLAAAAEVIGLSVTVPDRSSLAARAPSDEAAQAAGADRALVGELRWSDADLGWVADWRLAGASWQVRGVSFDEAFREAMRESARLLSGSGSPSAAK